jgi:ATP-dependent exoDNAse (exonuclease V) beta subunit
VSAARNSSDVRREVSIVDHLDDGTVIEGVIDLAYLDGEVWQLVEFKTDLNIEENRLQHEAQAQAYVQAIGRATGKPGRAVILRV